MEFDNSPVNDTLKIIKHTVKPYVDNFLDIDSKQAQDLRHRISKQIFVEGGADVDLSVSLAMTQDKETFLSGIFPEDSDPQDETAKFIDKTFVETGTLKYLTQEQIFELYERARSKPYPLSSNDYLNLGWNHSVYKQIEVQRSLASQGITMIVVFDDKTSLSTRSQNLMNSLGLQWVWESDLKPVTVH